MQEFNLASLIVKAESSYNFLAWFRNYYSYIIFNKDKK